MLRNTSLILRCFALVAALVGQAAAVSLDLYFRSYGPKGTLLVTSPELTWECWADDPQSITGVEAEIDGKPLTARYDAVSRKISATPASPLGPGQYQATMRVRYKGGGAHEKTWTITISDRALATLAPPDAAQKEALATANEIREEMDLPDYDMDLRINAAGLAHSKYLALNNASGHGEIEGKPGFVGKSHKERLEAYGYVGSSIENVAYGSETAAEAIKALVDAPYHRLAFLQPGKLSFGSGMDGKRLTMTCAASNESAIVCYPYDGQQKVSTTWSKPEKPDPLAIHGMSGKTVGYPIVLAYFSPTATTFKVDEVELKTAAGAPAGVLVNSPENDKNLDRAVFLLPREPLKAGTQYIARVAYSLTTSDGTQRAEKIWSFRTQ